LAILLAADSASRLAIICLTTLRIADVPLDVAGAQELSGCRGRPQHVRGGIAPLTALRELDLSGCSLPSADMHPTNALGALPPGLTAISAPALVSLECCAYFGMALAERTPALRALTLQDLL
jgi:hypothetical protein